MAYSSILQVFRGERPRLLLAFSVIAGLLAHGAALLHGTYRGTYDAYVHIFFASKYRASWFNPWVYNWFEGFDLTSYPPLVHQLIALLSHAIALEASYVVIQLVAILVAITGSFRFARVYLSPGNAALAAFAAAFNVSLAQAVHQYGQLPTTFALGFSLHAAAWLSAWLAGGRLKSLAATLLHLGIVLTAHHLTFFLFAPIISLCLGFSVLRMMGPKERRSVVTRLAIYGVAAVVLALTLLSPFIVFLLSGMPAQAAIPHASRTDFFSNMSILVGFFLLPAATILPFIPSLPLALRECRSLIPLAGASAFLLCLGLGGTTPLPRILFSNFWLVLTYDRFTTWGTFVFMPVIGWITGQVSAVAARLAILSVLMLAFAGFFVVLSQMRFQPDEVDVSAAAEFLNRSENRSHRYLTVGLGCQLARLSYMTDAPTVDGLYYTARTTEILRTSGLEAIDFAKYFGDTGLKVLDHFLTNPSKYSLRFVLSNDEFYDARLRMNGWKLRPGVGGPLRIWEVSKPVPRLPRAYFKARSPLPLPLRKLWGAYPFLILLVILLELDALWPTRRVLIAAASSVQGPGRSNS